MISARLEMDDRPALRIGLSALGPYPRDARLIDDFGYLQEAEAFADRMREIDAGGSHVSPVPQQREMDDPEPMI